MMHLAWTEQVRSARMREGKVLPASKEPFLSVLEAKTDEEFLLGNLQLIVEMLAARNLSGKERYILHTKIITEMKN